MNASRLVRLTDDELAMAATIGVRRVIDTADKPNRNFRETGDQWQRHIRSCCGEAAWAKWRNRWWCGATKQARFDVGEAQVRTVPNLSRGLQLRQSDIDHGYRNDPFVLVYALSVREYEIVGWLYGHEGMIAAYATRNGDGPFWRVPPADLHAFGAMPLERAS